MSESINYEETISHLKKKIEAIKQDPSNLLEIPFTADYGKLEMLSKEGKIPSDLKDKLWEQLEFLEKEGVKGSICDDILFNIALLDKKE